MRVKDLIKKLQTMDENHIVVGQMYERVLGTDSYTGKTARTIEVEVKFGDCDISLYDR